MTEIIMAPIGDIHPYEKNPRINDASVDAVAESIRQFGFRSPIIVDGDNVIIAGHTRLKAAKKLRMKKVPVIVADDLTEEQVKAYRLADNKVGENSLWDYDLLDGELMDIPTIDMELLGFMGESPVFDTSEDEGIDVFEDEAPEPDYEKETLVKKGEIWQLGDHRLMCGDSTSEKDMSKLMDGIVADISFTSPPYNAGHMDISIDGKVNKNTKKKYLNDADQLSDEDYVQFLKKSIEVLLRASNEVFYNMGVIAGDKEAIIEILHEYIGEFKDFIYWKKSHTTPHILKGTMSSVVELIMAFSATDNSRNFAIGDVHYFNGVIEGRSGTANEYADIHKATFPVYLPAEIVERFTKKGGTVLDCFGGTGTTLIACEQAGRTCYMMELEPVYCDVIIKRWENLTGRTAKKVA